MTTGRVLWLATQIIEILLILYTIDTYAIIWLRMITGHVLWLATQIIEILASSLHHRHLRHTSVKFDSEWLQVVYYG